MVDLIISRLCLFSHGRMSFLSWEGSTPLLSTRSADADKWTDPAKGQSLLVPSGFIDWHFERREFIAFAAPCDLHPEGSGKLIANNVILGLHL